MTMDLHADQIQGFFEKPVDHMYTLLPSFMPHVKAFGIGEL